MQNEIYSGLTAGIKLNSATDESMTFMTGFELQVTQEVLESVTLGNAWKGKYPGIKNWSGSCDGLFTLDEKQKVLFNALTNPNGTKDEAEVEMFFVLGADKILSGKALVSELKVNVKAEEKAEISFSFEGINELKEFVSAN